MILYCCMTLNKLNLKLIEKTILRKWNGREVVSQIYLSYVIQKLLALISLSFRLITVLQKQTDTELEFYYRDIVKGLMLITTLFKKPRVWSLKYYKHCSKAVSRKELHISTWIFTETFQHIFFGGRVLWRLTPPFFNQ